MKLIPLTKGMFAKVDDADFDKVNCCKWGAQRGKRTWYAQRNSQIYKLYLMHRLILEITDSSISVDHINGDGTDNQRSNLRIVTNTQNQHNARKRLGCTSVYKGVSSAIANGYQWSAKIRIEKRLDHIGYFANEADAAQAYNNRAFLQFGEYARLN